MSGHQDKHQQALREAIHLQATRTHTGSGTQWKVSRCTPDKRPHMAQTCICYSGQSFQDAWLFRRNLSECTTHVKSAAYTSLMRPTLEYSSAVWDPSSTEDINKLEKVQRQAARSVHSNSFDRTPGCVSKMVSDLGWEPLQKRRQFDRLTTLYKIQRGLVETDTGDIVRPNDKRTRGQQRLYQPSATVTVYKNSFFPRTIREWNLLPINVTDAATLEEFRAGLGTVLPNLQPLPSTAPVFTILIVHKRYKPWKELAVSFPLCWSKVYSVKNPDHFAEEEEEDSIYL